MSEHSAPVIPIAASPHFAVAAMVRQHTPEVVHYDPQLTTARILDQHDPVRLVNVLVYALAYAIVSPASTTQEWADAEIDRVTEELALDLEDDLIDLEEGEDDEEAGTEGGRDR